MAALFRYYLIYMTLRVYSNYECGDIDIPTEVLRTLALLHGTSVDYLLELTDDPRPYPRRR